MHVGNVAVIEPSEDGLDYDRLVDLIRGRIALAPRFRQRIRSVPGQISRPVWVNDESFDVTYHVRRSALPRPGTREQLHELVGRIMSRQLDRSRPLWEMYLVEGLEGGRLAILSKTHHAVVDDSGAIDIGQVILDIEPNARLKSYDEWLPEREPSSASLVADAVGDFVRRPTQALDQVRTGIGDLSRTASAVGKTVFGVAAAAVTATRSVPSSPLAVELSEQRRYATVDLSLADIKKVRRAHGGTINDVFLAIVAGGIRSWLMTRGESIGPRSVVPTLVPISVRNDQTGRSEVEPFVVDLPTGEGDPVVRLQRITFEMARHKESAQMLGAETITALSNFAPPTLHSLGARLGSDLSKRAYSLVITNVPGPQYPLYAAGSLMLASYPVTPLSAGQALSIGVTSYNGGVYIGLNADRDAMPDLDVLAQCIVESAQELHDAGTRKRARQGKP